MRAAFTASAVRLALGPDRLPQLRALMAETAILERWREAYVYAEPRALEQLDETVTECTADAAEAGISADELEKAAGGSLKDYIRTAIIDTSE
jgi:hypothetical protein